MTPMGIEPLAKIVLTTAGKIALRKAASLLPNNARAVDEAYTAMLQDMMLEVDAAFRAHVAHHEAKDPQFADRLAAALDEREARALFYRLGTEGAQATTKERMRMLAHALAGLYTPDLDAEMKSRVSRAVLALEPSDVVALRRAVATKREMRSIVPGVVREYVLRDDAYEPLVVAVCMADANVWDGGLYVTEVGRGVLKALELWH